MTQSAWRWFGQGDMDETYATVMLPRENQGLARALGFGSPLHLRLYGSPFTLLSTCQKIFITYYDTKVQSCFKVGS